MSQFDAGLLDAADDAGLSELLWDDPDRALIEVERHMVAEEGLRAFMPLAWHVIEGNESSFLPNWHIDAIAEHLEAVSRGEIKRLAIMMPPRHMKALDCETPILTTWGWKRHGDLRPGDFVFGADGQPKRVLAVTPPAIEETLDVTFDDDTVINAGHGHLWAIERDFPYGGPGSSRTRKNVVVPTPELIITGGSKDTRDPQRPDRIALCEPIQLPPRNLLIDPYLLGVWLGDGSTDSASLHASEQDIAHFSTIASITQVFEPVEGGTRKQTFYRLGVDGLQTRLRVLGLLGNKHIPDDYLTASAEQRLELFRGLMDTDGMAAAAGWCVYVTKLRHLAEQFVTLACSLGIKAHLAETWSTLKGKKFGPYYDVRFTPPIGMRIFKLERKQARVRGAQRVRTRRRYVTGIAPAVARPVNCITVEGALYLAGRRFVVTHNSLSVAVMWPAWDWIANPWRRFLFASYAHNLSIRDSVKCRRIVQSPWFRARWGQAFKITSDQNTKIRFENDKNGYRLATSVDGQLTGEGGDCIVVDDANNVRKAESEATRLNTNTWWDEALSTRLNHPKEGAYVLMQQRVNENDLAGHVLRKESIIPWTILCLPAEYEPDHPQRWIRDPRKEVGELLWPARMGRKEIDALKADLGMYGVAAQLQQRPAPREGGIFKRTWFSTTRVIPADTVWVRGWDFASTEKKLVKADPDWTVGAKVGWSRSLGKWIIGHIERFRADPHEVERRLLAIAEQDGIAIPIQMPQDPGSAGKSLAHNYLAKLSRFTAYADPVNGDKMSRALAWAGKAGAGMVLLLEGDWNEPFLKELTGFPTGAHDDQVDAVSSAFDRLVNNTFGIMDWYAQMLAKQGIDPAAIQTPSQQAAAAPAAPQAAPATPQQDPLAALARALGVAPPSTP